MYLFDVNVWVHAHREDSDRHQPVSAFVEGVLNGREVFGYSPYALSSFLRIVTHPKIFTIPSPFETAIFFVESVAEHPRSMQVLPGESMWNIFTHLSYAVRPAGNLFPDTFFAALAIESGCTWVTCDRDYTRFPGLKMKLL